MQLSDDISKHFRLAADQKSALERLGIKTIRDMLYYFPLRYTNISEIKLIRDLSAGDTVTLYGRISKLKMRKAFTSKIPMSEATLEDSSRWRQCRTLRQSIRRQARIISLQPRTQSQKCIADWFTQFPFWFQQRISKGLRLPDLSRNQRHHVTIYLSYNFQNNFSRYCTKYSRIHSRWNIKKI